VTLNSTDAIIKGLPLKKYILVKLKKNMRLCGSSFKYPRQQSCLRKLERLQCFDAATANLYDGVETAFAGVEAQLSALEGATYNSVMGTYFLPLNTSSLRESSETEFIQLISMQYGFDKETVGIMYKVYEKLQKKYPNISQEELDWRFVRLLGGLEYDEFKWDQTAGDPAIFRVSDKGVFIDRNSTGKRINRRRV